MKMLLFPKLVKAIQNFVVEIRECSFSEEESQLDGQFVSFVDRFRLNKEHKFSAQFDCHLLAGT